jgi:hypothetical protein
VLTVAFKHVLVAQQLHSTEVRGYMPPGIRTGPYNVAGKVLRADCHEPNTILRGTFV